MSEHIFIPNIKPGRRSRSDSQSTGVATPARPFIPSPFIPEIALTGRGAVNTQPIVHNDQRPDDFVHIRQEAVVVHSETESSQPHSGGPLYPIMDEKFLRVVTYNCHQGKGNLTQLAREIAITNADIICLQEYNKKVGEALKLGGYEQVAPKGNQGWFRNIIYTRLPIILRETFGLKDIAREAVAAHVKYNGQQICVVCLHLSSGAEAAALRGEQLEQLLKRPHYPNTILIGDFNMRKNEAVETRHYKSAPLLATYCNDNPCIQAVQKYAHPFDRCLYRGVALIGEPRLLGLATTASDHYGVCFSFQLGSEAEAYEVPSLGASYSGSAASASSSVNAVRPNLHVGESIEAIRARQIRLKALEVAGRVDTQYKYKQQDLHVVNRPAQDSSSYCC
jgi:endonuclease/exonuclease/phosphatase family metal-dependent hydrolase